MIALENISKKFGDKIVLADMTLEMSETGITCLLGASGCGKSTALRIAASLLSPDSGTVLIPPGSCGVVFQDARLLPWLTTAENLSLAIPTSERTKSIKEIEHVLTEVVLDPQEILSLFPRELSGGMAQRVGIARALLRGSKYLMLDEPFAALDAITRSELQAMLIELVRMHKIMALFVTHDMEEAFKIGTSILVMNNGKVATQLSREEFLSPAEQSKARNIIWQNL